MKAVLLLKEKRIKGDEEIIEKAEEVRALISTKNFQPKNFLRKKIAEILKNLILNLLY